MTDRSTITIRPAVLADLPALLAMRRAMLRDMRFADQSRIDDSARQFPAWLEPRLVSGEFRAWLAQNGQEKAWSTQTNLLSYLEDKSVQGRGFRYESFWISNLVMVEAKQDVINELMLRMDVIQMDLDAILELDKPVEVVENAPEGTESVEAGLKIINAHLLWALGITGQGRLVMGIDTGVQLQHPALQYKWRGNHVPYNQAWFDPSGGTTTPNDCDYHGSHTMGTMVGRSITTADTVGVAINAEWIAAKTICSSPHTSNSIAAFQWATESRWKSCNN